MGTRAALMFCLASCAVRLEIPDEPIEITCATDAECPDAMVCIGDLGRCASTGSACVDRAGERFVAVQAGTPCALDAERRGVCLNADCRESRCGDGFTDTEVLQEECDAAGGNSDTQIDSCRTDCRRAHCGDSVLDSGEQCDNGPLNADGAPCSPVHTDVWRRLGAAARGVRRRQPGRLDRRLFELVGLDAPPLRRQHVDDVGLGHTAVRLPGHVGRRGRRRCVRGRLGPRHHQRLRHAAGRGQSGLSARVTLRRDVWEVCAAPER